MRDKAVSIDLNTNVEVGEENIIVPGDQATFQRKNTEKYLGLLSNMKSRSGQGWMTTTNKEVTLVEDDGTTATLNINGKLYSIDSSLKLIGQYSIEPNIAGDITSVASDSYYIYYIIRDKLNNVYNVKHSLTGGIEIVNQLGSGDEKVFNAFYLAGSTNYMVSKSNESVIYDKDDNVVETLTGYETRRAANNGWYEDTNNWAYGRDDNDQYYAWARARYNGGTANLYNYIGCIDEKGNITGEPFPCLGVSGYSITYAAPTRLSNGVLRWTRLNNSDADLINEMAGKTYSAWDLKTKADWQASPPQQWYSLALSETGLNTWVAMVSKAGVYAISRSGIHDTYGTVLSHWLVTDPGANPGQFWNGAVGEFDNVFPMKYIYTNKQANRGRTFVYGKGFIRCYVINGGVVGYTNNTNYIFNPFSSDSYVYENRNGTVTTSYLDANKNGANTVYKDPNIPVPFIANDGDVSLMIDSTVYDGNIRVHPLSAEQFTNKAWNEWLWSIGGSNYGNEAFLSDIPFYVKYGDFITLGYSGYTIGFSWNKCLINTPNKEIEVWNHTDIDGKHIIATSENVYVLGTGEFKIKKLADYIFATNCITEWNTLQEGRNGIIRLVRSFIPYNMSFIINSRWRTLQFKCPEDGSAANGVWMTGAAVNANLKDDYLAASFLLPAIEVPLYINAVDMDTFNKQIVNGNIPLLQPLKEDLLFSDEELLVYYTHSQSSTDIIYRETLKGNDAFFNSDYEDNNWWLTSTTIMFPVGIASKMSGINYMSSTVDLEGNYTARLYVNNNQAYLVYNIAEQVYYGSTIFTIYTNNYYYDGEAIYSIVGAGNTEFVCYAIGLRFLGNSGTEAYFYSPYDKCIYLFSGSNTLSKAKSLAKMSDIIDSMFSSVNQRMYILDDHSNVLWLSNESSGLYRLNNIDHLESSEKGCIFVSDDGFLIYSPKEDEFEDIVPMEIETSWIGDNTSLQKFGFATIQLYAPTPEASKIKVLMETKDGTDIKTTAKEVNIKKSDWKGTYLRIRVTPENANGQAFKFIIETDDYVRIMNIEFAFEQISNSPAPSTVEISV